MKELNLKMLFGTELLLRYNDLFIQMLDNYLFDKINCSIDRATIDIFRGSYGESYYSDSFESAKFIFNDERINLTHEQSANTMSLDDLIRDYGFNYKYNFNEKLIEDFDLELPEKYITISTKILLALSKDVYESYKIYLFNILNQSKYPIIIIGEREIKQCVEYDIHKPYSIYNDLIHNLNNYIDFTISDSGLNSDLIPLKKTFFILNKSKMNIYMSCAGIKTIQMYVSNNIIGLTQHDLVSASKNRDNNENIFLTTDFFEFIYNLNINLKNKIN